MERDLPDHAVAGIRRHTLMSAITPKADVRFGSEGDTRFSKAQGLKPADLRQAVINVRQKLDTSERRTCRTVGMARSKQQYKARNAEDDEALRLALIRLAKQNGHNESTILIIRDFGWH